MPRGLKALFLTFVFVSFAACSSSPEEPSNAIFFFSSELRNENFAKAYDRLCSEIRAKVSFEDFEKDEGRTIYPFLAATYWQPLEDRTFNGVVRISVDPRVVTNSAAPEAVVTVRVVKEGRKWRLCEMVTG